MSAFLLLVNSWSMSKGWEALTMGDDQQDAIGASEVGTDPPFALERVGGAVGTQAAVGRPVLADEHEGIDAETGQEYEPQEVFQPSGPS